MATVAELSPMGIGIEATRERNEEVRFGGECGFWTYEGRGLCLEELRRTRKVGFYGGLRRETLSEKGLDNF